MVKICCVRGCKSELYAGCGISFHKFPKDEEIRKKWVDVIPIRNKITKHSTICGNHFNFEDFATTGGKKTLKQNAVPTLFPVVVPLSKKVYVLSDIQLQPGTSSEPPPKKLKQEKESVFTQTSDITNSPRKRKLQREIKVLSQKLKRRDATINNLKSLLAVIKKKCDNFDEVKQVLKINFENINLKLNDIKSYRGIRYSDDVKSFALSLYFYSGKAYRFLRNHVCLPHPATLRRVLATHNCNVGFMTEVMDYLKLKVSENTNLQNVALIFDSMHIKTEKVYDPKTDKFWGQIDFGGILPEESEKYATEALVFQIVSLKEKFKCPIAYFFIDKISANLQAQLVQTAIRMLADINVIVRSLTADGTVINKNTYEILGCDFSSPNMKTSFDHPTKPTKVYCIFDPAHMIKLARTVFAETSLSSDKGLIKFEYVKELQKLQEEEGLKLANKISKTHINFFGKKMNVRLAVQVLSSSVANAIAYLRSTGHPNFVGSEATEEYLRMLDRIFDFFNSKNPYGTGFKSPMRKQNKNVWSNVFAETREYLRRLKLNGKDILTHNRKTPALGLIIDTFSFEGLANDLFEKNEYLLTHKCSQDHLEMFFSCIRARGGSNDNPNALEFRYIMRKLLFRNSVKPSVNANCTDADYETSPILEFRSAKRSNLQLVEIQSVIDAEKEVEKIDNLMRQVEKKDVSDFKNNILYYISGYIVNKMLSKITCEHCQAALLTTRHVDHDYFMDICKFSSFTTFVDKGGLKYASKLVFEVVKYAEKLFATTSSESSCDSYIKKMLNIITQYFFPKLDKIFIHPVLSIKCENRHEIEVIKDISRTFLTLRLRAFAKNETLKIVGHKATIRQKLRKTIIFSNV